MCQGLLGPWAIMLKHSPPHSLIGGPEEAPQSVVGVGMGIVLGQWRHHGKSLVPDVVVILCSIAFTSMPLTGSIHACQHGLVILTSFLGNPEVKTSPAVCLVSSLASE